MLPFMQPKKMSTLIMAKTKPEGGAELMPEDKNMPLHAVAQDLIDAVHAKDISGVADALKASHDINSANSFEESPEGEEDAAS